jgi:serine phosphatase RsbU (regulator of sigma subunit)
VFILLAIARCWPSQENLTFSNDGQADELRAREMALGIMRGMDYEEKETILEIGENTLFYSDGLVEAHDPQREMFSSPRLWGMWRNTVRNDPWEICS